jgi:hypothetical protein
LWCDSYLSLMFSRICKVSSTLVGSTTTFEIYVQVQHLSLCVFYIHLVLLHRLFHLLQCWFKHIRCIKRSTCPTGSNNSMNFIDKIVILLSFSTSAISAFNFLQIVLCTLYRQPLMRYLKELSGFIKTPETPLLV